MNKVITTIGLKDIMAEAKNIFPHKNLNDQLVSSIYIQAEKIYEQVVVQEEKPRVDWDKRLDDIFTSKYLAFPSMILLLGLIFWLTIAGCNVPSEMLATGLFWVKDYLVIFCLWLNAPAWFIGFFLDGVYTGMAWVVAVMLPPMAIFFPCFTLLEDMGYLPRVAFNLDRFFKKAGAHGKQALTMSMGFGCNAAGIIACRIIESPRERLIAMITNVFVPCNGRFPTLIALAGILTFGLSSVLGTTAIVVSVILLGIAVTLAVSWALSKTLLKGVTSSFTLELPPYRKPQIGKVIVRSIFDRTLFVLRRAIYVAIPAGAITWLMANIHIGDISVLTHCAGWLNPLGHMLGMDGYILMAFILGLPANEIVLPILIMSYLATGTLTELNSLDALYTLFVVQHGWTWLTVTCMMLFSLLHYPCGTTIMTIWKESGSAKWTLLSALIPLGVGFAVCFILAQSARLLGLV